MTSTDIPDAVRAVGYARISLDRAEGAGVERQTKAITDLATSRGYDLVEVVVENSVSAYTGVTRPGYARVVSMIERGEVERVIVWHLDRLHRNVRETLDYMETTRAALVTTEAVQGGGIDPTTADAFITTTVLAAVAENESRHKSERISAAYEQMNHKGVPYAGGRRTFGYNQAHDELVEAEAEALRRAADYILAGGTLYGAVKRLNELGYLTTAGRPFYPGAVRDLLTNPRMAALATHKGEVVGTAQWPAVWSPETYERLHAVLTNPDRRTNKGRGRKPQWLLSGLAVCGCPECTDAAEPMVLYSRTRRDKGYERRLYYVKSNTGQSSKGHVAINADDVDELVTEAVLMRLGLPDIANRLARTEANDEVAELTTRRAGLRERIDALEAEFMAGNLDASQFGRLNRKLMDDAAKVDEALARHADADTGAAVVAAVGPDPARWWVTADLARRRALVNALVTVRIRRGKRGAKRFDPERVVLDWHA